MSMGEQGDHGDEAGDGENIDRGGRLFANVDLLVRDVVADCESLLMEALVLR